MVRIFEDEAGVSEPVLRRWSADEVDALQSWCVEEAAAAGTLVLL
jgi:hypothetical protein